ncbi:superoxide dismutase family protein [Streptomyces sp. NPDC091376]|uniref:superoxide dismutase family protein n=1 Tax=Streptomyces sp. NPDC091376 TaxID=3365994 RepID=UPI0038113970
MAVTSAGVLAGAAALGLLAVGAVGAAYGTSDGSGVRSGSGSGSAGVGVGVGADVGEGLVLRVHGRFAPPGSFVPSTALTYDRTLVPAGAWIVVEQEAGRAGTVVRARVGGVKAGHAFGAHVHTEPCDAAPDRAGPHYRHHADPAGVAEPANEVWLDFTTDATGQATVEARHDWGFRRGSANSLVLHQEQGGAGARVACFTIPFGGYGTP